jgi:hypothetical protein
MSERSSIKQEYKEDKVSVRIKIACLWVSVMFCYIYADIKAFYETGFIEQIMKGNLSGLIVNQQFLLLSAILMSIPPLMVFLTLILKAKINRIVNLVLGVAHILLAVAILFGPGEIWSYYYWYTALEILFHVLIVFYAIRWPKETVHVR